MRTETKHYVTFYSPGTLFSEESRKPIDCWSPELAVRMAEKIVERHGAQPFAFSFSTWREAPDVVTDDGETLRVEPKEKARSGRYFIGGDVESYERVCARNDPREDILRSNMSGNDHAHVVYNRSSFLSVQPFGEDDCVIDPKNGAVLVSGKDAAISEYRQRFIAERKAERDEFMRKWEARQKAKGA